MLSPNFCYTNHSSQATKPRPCYPTAWLPSASPSVCTAFLASAAAALCDFFLVLPSTAYASSVCTRELPARACRCVAQRLHRSWSPLVCSCAQLCVRGCCSRQRRIKAGTPAPGSWLSGKSLSWAGPRACLVHPCKASCRLCHHPTFGQPASSPHSFCLLICT